MDKAMKLSGTIALGTAALATTPGHAPAVTVFETEPNNTFATAQAVALTVGDSITGGIASSNDDIDFFRITGLSPGPATFSLEMISSSNVGELEATVFADAATPVTSVDINANPTLFPVTVTGSGTLVLGVKEQATSVGFESYRITLQSVSPTQVPEPATLALAAAGFSALGGLRVARRRKHG